MKLNFKSINITLSGLLIVLMFQNCGGKTLFNQGATDSELTLDSQNPDGNRNQDGSQNGNGANTKVEAGSIVFRPRCNVSIVVDYDSFCRVGVAGGMHITGSDVTLDRVQSCEIVSNGQSVKLHLLGPEMIEQEVNNGA